MANGETAHVSNALGVSHGEEKGTSMVSNICWFKKPGQGDMDYLTNKFETGSQHTYRRMGFGCRGKTEVSPMSRGVKKSEHVEEEERETGEDDGKDNT
jgi:hypothetical protein